MNRYRAFLLAVAGGLVLVCCGGCSTASEAQLGGRVTKSIGDVSGVPLLLARETEFTIRISIRSDDLVAAINGKCREKGTVTSRWASSPNSVPSPIVTTISGFGSDDGHTTRSLGAPSGMASSGAQPVVSAATAVAGVFMIEKVVPIEFDIGFGWEGIDTVTYVTPAVADSIFKSDVRVRFGRDGLEFLLTPPQPSDQDNIIVTTGQAQNDALGPRPVVEEGM